MHRLAIPDLFAEIEVVATKVDDLLAEFENFATKLSYQSGQISQLKGWKWVDKRAVHDDTTCTRNLPVRSKNNWTRKTGWAKLYLRGGLKLLPQPVCAHG
jgi:hypothetical protein